MPFKIVDIKLDRRKGSPMISKLTAIIIGLSISVLAHTSINAKGIKAFLGAAAPDAVLTTDYRQPDGYVMPNGYTEFNPDWSPAEKKKYFNDTIDFYANAHYTERYRFDRNKKEVEREKYTLYGSELGIENLLNKCVKLVDPEKSDEISLGLNSTKKSNKSDNEYDNGLRPHYLSGQMKKCSGYLYTDKYDSSDFEFIFSSNNLKDEELLKKQLIEKLYESIYLETRDAGLLRKMEGAYYPKSLLREHAYRTKLTEYIQKQQALAGTALPHDELAIAYFGSRQAWIDDFNLFLDQKGSKLNLTTEKVFY